MVITKLDTYVQAGLMLWIDTGKDTVTMALDAHRAGWLIAPGIYFHHGKILQPICG